MINIKRRHYLVNKGVQFRYMGLVAVPLIITLAGLYCLMYSAVLNQILVPEGVIAMLLPAMTEVNIVVMLILPVVLFLILKTALVYSNRIVGPLPRIEKEIDKVLAGNFSLRLKVRNKDELNNFISKINMLLDKVEKEKGLVA